MQAGKWARLTTVWLGMIAAGSTPLAAQEAAGSQFLVEGTGSTHQEAQQAAWRQAVLQALTRRHGVETIARNFKQWEKLLAESEKYITQSTLIHHQRHNGLVQVRIICQVKLPEKNHSPKSLEPDKSRQGRFLLRGDDISQTLARRKKFASLTAKNLNSSLQDLMRGFYATVEEQPYYDEKRHELSISVLISMDMKYYRSVYDNLKSLLEKTRLDKKRIVLRGRPLIRKKGVYLGRNPRVLGPPVKAPNTQCYWVLWLCEPNVERHTTLRWRTYLLDVDPVESLEGCETAYRETLEAYKIATHSGVIKPKSTPWNVFRISIILEDSQGIPVRQTSRFIVPPLRFTFFSKEGDMPVGIFSVARWRQGARFFYDFFNYASSYAHNRTPLTVAQQFHSYWKRRYDDWSENVLNVYVSPYAFAVNTHMEFLYMRHYRVPIVLKLNPQELAQVRQVSATVQWVPWRPEFP